MTWGEKKIYVRGLIKVDDVQRRRGREEKSRRNYSMRYFLKAGIKLTRVCKKMFVGTLGLQDRTVVNWVKEDFEDMASDKNKPPNRKKEARRNIFKSKVSAVQEFLINLPKMESHYCRASSERLYLLEPVWRSKSHVYKFYKNVYCKEKSVDPVSDAKFYNKMQEMKLSLYRPKKDECDVCVAYRAKNISEEVYQHHQVLKEEASVEKDRV